MIEQAIKESMKLSNSPQKKVDVPDVQVDIQEELPYDDEELK